MLITLLTSLLIVAICIVLLVIKIKTSLAIQEDKTSVKMII